MAIIIYPDDKKICKKLNKHKSKCGKKCSKKCSKKCMKSAEHKYKNRSYSHLYETKNIKNIN